MADNRRLTEEQKRRIAEAHRRAEQGKTATQRSTQKTASAAGSAPKKVSSSAKNSAGSRNSGTTQGNGNKKMTSRMKSTIRKSVAGVCLASSLIIAAIPGDKSGTAKALDPTWTPSNNITNYSDAYDDARSDSRNGDVDITAKAFLDPTTHSPKDWSFTIKKNGDNYVLDSQFEFYEAAPPLGSTSAVISSYNPASIGTSLNIDQFIVQKYDSPDKDHYENFVKDMRNRYFILPADDEGYIHSFVYDDDGNETDAKKHDATVLAKYLPTVEGTTQFEDDETSSRFYCDTNSHKGCIARKVHNSTT